MTELSFDCEYRKYDGGFVCVRCGDRRASIVKRNCSADWACLPGSVLQIWFLDAGFVMPAGCPCKTVAARMNRRGPDWCRQRITYLCARIRKNASIVAAHMGPIAFMQAVWRLRSQRGTILLRRLITDALDESSEKQVI